MELIELGGQKTRGRQKTEIKKIDEENDRLITFSKRRTGIYKKASDLATLSRAEIGIVMFSPTGKPFSFGQPSVEAVLERYVNSNIPKEPLNDGGVQPVMEAQRRKKTEELSEQLDAAISRLEAERKRGKSLREQIKASRAASPTRGNLGWWEAKIDELSVPQLDAVSVPMEDFFNAFVNHLNKLENH